jgi:hypothetical protein
VRYVQIAPSHGDKGLTQTVLQIGILLALLLLRHANEGEHAVRPIISDQTTRTWQTGQTTLALLLTAALGLAGCGGGGGGGGGSTDTTANTTTTTTPDESPQTPDNNDELPDEPNASTLLDDNPLAGPASFDNFTTTGVQLTAARILADKGVTFAGSPVFLKLARSDGSASCNGDASSDDQLLFLGQVNPDQALDLLVDLPLDTVALCYEIFTPIDDTLFGEITL